MRGIREGNAFQLQRILNVVDTMPSVAAYERLRTSIADLLKLSDAVAERAGVRENSLGAELPLDTLPSDLVADLPALRELVRFSESDLERLQVARESLAEFAFDPEQRDRLARQAFGHTDLERYPVAFVEESTYVLLPTAVGSAITRFVVEFVASLDQTDAFERSLAAEYAEAFRDTPLLGPGIPVRFQRIDGGRIGSLVREVDPGRFLHLVFFVDGLEGFFEGGLSGGNAAPEALASALTLHLRGIAEEARQKVDFIDGLTFLVVCGYGRRFAVPLPRDLPENWRLESIAAHDLATLGWLSDFDSLSLWRILDALEAIARHGTELLNVNGFLNLVAWALENKGHLVPHGELPDDFVSEGGHRLIAINQNSLRNLRHTVATQWDSRRILDAYGVWVAVKKFEKAYFEEDNAAPLYVGLEDLGDGRLRAVYDAPCRPWWIEILPPEDADRHFVFEYWMMLCTWLRQAVPVLDAAYPGLSAAPISIGVAFAEIVGVTRGRSDGEGCR